MIATPGSPGPPSVCPVTGTRWHLRIDGAVNLRDVGGLPCRGGGSTRHGVLLRSGTLRLLTEADADVLTTVLDVGPSSTSAPPASSRSTARRSSPGPGRHGPPPLARDNRPALPESADPDAPTAALARTYRQYLDERGHHIATAARLVAVSDRAVLLHCAAGKDRTGVTVALLLDAVGVERSAVVADYTATNDVIEEVVRALVAAQGYTREIEGADLDAHRARPGVLGDLLDGVDREYGGGAAWLRTHGLTDPELVALRRRLVRFPAVRPGSGGPVAEPPRTAGHTPSSPPSR